MTLLQDLGAPGMEEWISADLNRLREVSERSWKKDADAVAGNRVLAKYRSGSASVRRSMFCQALHVLSSANMAWLYSAN